ncbi:unnamed protein product [Orchesella dallaii]|uniref:C2H2-type domain-containing protein n=1 Tax=Orchesella dallaii TaxID=48710 RepID=A0ABP1PSB3_9HEXA
MSSNNSSPSASIPVEHVYMWYSCVSVKTSCSRAFHTIPLLKKHFLECHPDEQFVLPYTPPPGALEGRIIYHKEYFIPTGELVQGADNTMGHSGSADVSLQEGSTSSKKECGICHKIFKNRSYRDAHLEKQHGIIINCYDSTDDELESSEDENHPAAEAIPAKEDGEGGQGTPVAEGDNTIPKVVENGVPPEPEACRSSEDGGGHQGTPADWDKLIPKIVQNKDAPKPRVSKSCSLPNPKPKLSQFICNICDKSFQKLQPLKRHFMNHTGVRPFKCSLCKGAFSLKQVLIQHLMNTHIHKQERTRANDMANKAGLNFLQNVKATTAEELKNVPHCSIESAVLDYVFENKSGQQTAASQSSKLSVKDNQKVGTVKKTRRPRGTNFSCQLCPYQCPSEKVLEPHGKLHEKGSKAQRSAVPSSATENSAPIFADHLISEDRSTTPQVSSAVTSTMHRRNVKFCGDLQAEPCEIKRSAASRASSLQPPVRIPSSRAQTHCTHPNKSVVLHITSKSNVIDLACSNLQVNYKK